MIVGCNRFIELPFLDRLKFEIDFHVFQYSTILIPYRWVFTQRIGPLVSYIIVSIFSMGTAESIACKA